MAAFWMVIKLAVAGAFGSLIIGTLIAVLRVSAGGVLRGAATAYVTLIPATRR